MTHEVLSQTRNADGLAVRMDFITYYVTRDMLLFILFVCLFVCLLLFYCSPYLKPLTFVSKFFAENKNQTLLQHMACNLVRKISAKMTVFIRINAAAFIKFFAIPVRRLFEGGVYLKFDLFLANNSMVTEHLNFENRNML